MCDGDAGNMYIGQCMSGPVLYNLGGIVLSDTQQTVLTNLECFYLRVPSCTALVGALAECCSN